MVNVCFKFFCCWKQKKNEQIHSYNQKQGIPSGGSSEDSVKSQVWCAVSYDSKFLYIHANRRRKKRKGPTINPEYRLELKGLNARELGYVVEKEFGDGLQAAGVEIFIVDNDRKAHSNTVRDEWAKFGIKVWPGAGIVGDRCLISEFTGKDESELGGFPVDFPDCMVNDQRENHSWKNLGGGLYSTFQKRKPSLQTIGGFINDIKSTWENLS